MPRSDLVLFVTSSDRPFTDTEHQFLETIRDWGKKIVLILNKEDIFERPGELEEVLGFVRQAATQLLGTTPEIFPRERSAGMEGQARETQLSGRRAVSS